MKKKILLNILLVFGLILTSCTTEVYDPNAIDLQADVDEMSNLAQTGSWQITRFIDSGNDKTANFSGYNFSFNADGSLFADSSSENATGSWSITLNTAGDSFNSQDDCNNCNTSQLTEVLTGCSDWFVDKLERSDENLEDSISNYRFNFSSDGSLVVHTASTTYSGTWESRGNGNDISATISISGVSGISDTWNLHEIELENGESKVDLRIEGDDRLRFKNNCTLINKASNADGSYIDFNIFFANPANFSELNANWDIISRSDIKIELSNSVDSNSGADLLTFENN